MDEQTEVDADAMEDFYVALSAAIESGIDSSAHAACDLYHAALARAEAAEAEAARLKEAGRMVQEEVAAWRDSYEALNRQRLALAARVAELAAQAAQGWRPVTEDWPPYNERVIIGHGGGYGGGWSAFARRVRTDNRDGDDWLMDDDTTLAFESAVVAMRRPLPPAPQEPTQ